MTLDDLLTLQLRIIQAVGESEHRIKELVLKVAGESDKAKIEKLVQELAEHRAKLTEAVKQQTES